MVAANRAVSLRVRLEGILIIPSEIPSFDLFSTSIRPIRPDFEDLASRDPKEVLQFDQRPLQRYLISQQRL